MGTCKKCKKEYMNLKETQEYCPACKHHEELRTYEAQNRHLHVKQKRFTSE